MLVDILRWKRRPRNFRYFVLKWRKLIDPGFNARTRYPPKESDHLVTDPYDWNISSLVSILSPKAPNNHEILPTEVGLPSKFVTYRSDQIQELEKILLTDWNCFWTNYLGDRKIWISRQLSKCPWTPFPWNCLDGFSNFTDFASILYFVGQPGCCLGVVKQPMHDVD